MNQDPKVGVGIIITKDNHVLLMKRKGVHGTGAWSTPGGHLDFGESPEQCAAREAKEEVGLDVVDIRFRAVTNDVFDSTGRHYITIWMEAETWVGEPVLNAPYESDTIQWFSWHALPQPLFIPLQHLISGQYYHPQQLFAPFRDS